jgi:hypothetical protein
MLESIKGNIGSDQVDRYHQYINQVLGKKEDDNIRFHKLVLETCHLAKFLSRYDSSIEIVTKSENPDFIIRKDNSLVGVEHETIVNQEFKQVEGSLKRLIADVENEYRRTHPYEKRLLNIYMNDIRYSKNNKTDLIKELLEIVNHYIKTQTVLENDFIYDITMMDHSRLDFVCNLGGWWQRNLDFTSLLNAIKRKEMKITEYQKNSGCEEQWLLLVIGSLGKSSYEIDSPESLNQPFDTTFNKVFILEDFKANVYELK